MSKKPVHPYTPHPRRRNLYQRGCCTVPQEHWATAATSSLPV